MALHVHAKKLRFGLAMCVQADASWEVIYSKGDFGTVDKAGMGQGGRWFHLA